MIGAAAFGAGWTVHGWKTDSDDLAEVKKITDAMLVRESQRDAIDIQYNTIQSELGALKRRKPVECNFTDDQLRHVNQALRGPVPSAASIEER